jgi:hypothetical protein
VHGDRGGGEDYGTGWGSQEPAEEREGATAEEGEGAGVAAVWEGAVKAEEGRGDGWGITTSRSGSCCPKLYAVTRIHQAGSLSKKIIKQVMNSADIENALVQYRKLYLCDRRTCDPGLVGFLLIGESDSVGPLTP